MNEVFFAGSSNSFLAPLADLVNNILNLNARCTMGKNNRDQFNIFWRKENRKYTY